MSIFKRGHTYWFHFWFDGRHIQRSTKQGNPRVARQMEAAHRTVLAKGEVGLADKLPVPSLEDFAPRFVAAVQDQCKPATLEFYAAKMAGLLRFRPIGTALLDRIDEALIADFVRWRRAQVGVTAVNRALATLRRALRLAQEWRLIDRVPRIRLLPGERIRDFVLGPQVESLYLESCSEPLLSVAQFLLQTGLRVGELFRLEWGDVHLEPIGDATRGYIHVRDGKSRNAKRNVPLTEHARQVLLRQREISRSALVFVRSDCLSPLSRSTIDHQHEKVRKTLGLPLDFVIHSFRHTMLTRLGEAGADAFTIMKIAGHSTVTVSQRYVHPTPETVERAIDRLEGISQAQKRRVAATISATAAYTGATAIQ